MPNTPTRRRPVPPPKTESEARLRDDLTSPHRSPTAVSKRKEIEVEPPMENADPDAQQREAMKHLTLPPGWNLRNEVDVTYHTHVAKPVVHETIIHDTTELVEPKITREYHRYHQYDYIQPVKAEIPNQSYATNTDGEVIHAPGGLGKRLGENSHWEQDRQDRGYAALQSPKGDQERAATETEAGRDNMAGPFPLQAEGGGERVLQDIRDGEIARRFGGTLTSSSATTPNLHQKSIAEDLPIRPRGGDFEQNQQPYAPHIPPPRRAGSYPADQDPSTSQPTRASNFNPDAHLEQDFNRLSLQQQQHPEAKPLPPLPDTSPHAPYGTSGVRRMSGDNKLRDKFTTDSSRPV